MNPWSMILTYLSIGLVVSVFGIRMDWRRSYRKTGHAHYGYRSDILVYVILWPMIILVYLAIALGKYVGPALIHGMDYLYTPAVIRKVRTKEEETC